MWQEFYKETKRSSTLCNKKLGSNYTRQETKNMHVDNVFL